MNYNNGRNPNMYQSNPLLRNYQSHQQSNIPFNNNALLRNNPMFMNNMNQQNSAQMQQMQQMQMMYQKQLQDMQKVKQIEKLNELENKIDKEKIRESVIQPIKLARDNKDVEKKYSTFQTEYKPHLQKLYQSRTNQPYKNIIKDEKYIKNFLCTPVPKSDTERKKLQKRMVVHRVTNADKEGVDEEYDHLVSQLERHNDELKVLYSASKELEHKKKFEYNHKYKYRIKYDPSEHSKMKKDRIAYYKKQQKKAEEGNQKYLEIVENLLNTGFFTEEELREHGGVTDIQKKGSREDSSQKDQTKKSKSEPEKKDLWQSKRERYRQRQRNRK